RPAAAALGMAMQRTNILRDIDEDAAAGRSYLAEESVARFGPPTPGARAALLRDQIARADALYEEGLAGVPLLLHGRAAIRAAAWMYREILRQIERDGDGGRAGRAVVAGPRKLWIAARRVPSARWRVPHPTSTGAAASRRARSSSCSSWSSPRWPERSPPAPAAPT